MTYGQFALRNGLKLMFVSKYEKVTMQQGCQAPVEA